MTEIALEVLELSHLYKSYKAVDKISFKVEKGIILGLLGPNGAGKSTTVKMLTTLLPPTTGTAKIMGFDIVDQAVQVRETIGYVPQQLSADGDLTGYENLLFSSKLYGLSKEKRKKRIKETLELMGLTDYRNVIVRGYSGGMIRRLEICLALLHEPSVLFLDEPTVGLDPAARRVLWRKIENLQHQFGTTLLMTTHDMEEADILCDTVAFMHLGKILMMDSPENLKRTLGPYASLNDVFIQFTGTSMEGGGDYKNAEEIRRTVSHLD